MKLSRIVDCIFLSVPAKNHVQKPCIELFRAHYDSSRMVDVSSCQRAKCIKCDIGGCVLPAYAWQPMPSQLQPPSPTPHPCHVASICCLGNMGLVSGWGAATHGGGGPNPAATTPPPWVRWEKKKKAWKVAKWGCLGFFLHGRARSC